MEACQPDVLEVAWLRGQAGGVLEVIVFDLCRRGLAELTAVPGDISCCCGSKDNAICRI